MTSVPSTSPVFVLGALRSGTTLFRLMLNAHPGIANPGEVDFLFDFLVPDPSQPDGWRYDRAVMSEHRIFRARDIALRPDLEGTRLLEDMIAQLARRHPGVLTLNVHRNAERIIQVLPQARFIHVLRDPRDVARSSIGMGWSGNSYYGLAHWLRTETDWDRARPRIPDAKILEVRFEALMTGLESELSRVCDFLGVPFRPEMLEYHLETSYGPPDPKIAQQWKAKARPREIALLEGMAGPLLSARGYAPAGQPAFPGLAERAYLGAENRLLRWQFQIRRFGLPMFLAAHGARLLRIKPAKRYLRRRMDEKVTHLLK
jgi:hypothetical protein